MASKVENNHPAKASRFLVLPEFQEKRSEYFNFINRKDLHNQITYQFTRDPHLIEEYIKLREKIYAEELELGGLLGSQDEYDDFPYTHTLVLLRNGRCIGGGRLTFSENGNHRKLPFETDGFEIKKVMPELGLQNESYGEVSRVVVMPEFRSVKVAGNIYLCMNIKAFTNDIKYVFTLSPYSQARSYKIICTKLGIKTEIKEGIRISKECYGKHVMCLSTYHVNREVNKLI